MAEAKDCDKICYCCGGRGQEPPSSRERLAALGLRGREWHHRLAGRYFASLNAILLLLVGIFSGGRRRRLMRRAK
ncbi:MAG: hypothetical protein ACNA74_05805 [Desulfurivibrio sp.]